MRTTTQQAHSIKMTSYQRCVPTGKCSNQPAHPHSLISLRCPHKETLHPWLANMRPVKFLIRLCQCAGWSESSQGAHVLRCVFWRYCPNVFYTMYITKTCLYNIDPLKPHFHIVKLGLTGVYIIFHISAQNIDCGYSLEPPRRGGSNEYPRSMFWAEIWKISGEAVLTSTHNLCFEQKYEKYQSFFFYLKNFSF